LNTLDYIDFDIIKHNPKILCGYSDITSLQNAIYAKTGLVTYSGPHYSTFAMLKDFDWTLDYVKKCLMHKQSFTLEPSKVWSDDAWYLDQENRTFMENSGFWVINPGSAQGTILGANLCTFNLLQGTKYMPDLSDAIIFLEDDSLGGDCTLVEFDRNLQSLMHQENFNRVKAILIGRFQKISQVSRELLTKVIKSKQALAQIPVIANLDFGHTDPIITYPIGGTVNIIASLDKVNIEITEH
jgi:muramoyltetrapeptide carboxypeptidase